MNERKETLGATLRRFGDEVRDGSLRRGLERAQESGRLRDPMVPSAEELAAVAARFKAVRRTLEKSILIAELPRSHVVLGESGLPYGQARTESEAAMIALSRSCWPLTIGEGLQLKTNPFHRTWAQFCKWADDEELALAFEEQQDTRLQTTKYVIHVWPRHGWLVGRYPE